MGKMKGFVVYPTYKVVDERAYVLLYGRLENGESFCTVNYFRPYFYIKKSDLKKAQKIEDFEVEENGFKNKDGEEVIKIILNVPSDVPKFRKSFSENKIKHYEADIRFPYRFLIDNNINGCVEIDGEYLKEDKIDRVYEEPEIKPTNFKPKLKVMSIDIETDIKSKSIYCISVMCENFKKVLIVSDNKKLKNSECFSSEADMLEGFVNCVNEIDPDIITGWNVIDFDLKVIYEKCKKEGIDFNIGRDNSRVKLTIEKDFFRESKANVPGRVVLDALHLLRVSFIKVTDYKLDTVASELLGEGKSVQFVDKGNEIEEMYLKNQQKLIDYNLKDSELVLKVIDKTGVIDLTIQRSMLTGMPPDRVNASIASFDSLYIKESRKRGLVVPSYDYVEKNEETVGGYVRESEPGIYDYLDILDFKSLYPSMIRTFNIDPMGLDENCSGKNLIKVPSGACFKREIGILPDIIEGLWKHREEARKSKNKLARHAIKILMNCFTPDTDILTKDGIKKITEVKKGDWVYSLNPKTNKTELNQVTKEFKYKYKGKMIVIKSNCVDYIITPNHKFFVKEKGKYFWKEAQELADSSRQFWLPKHTPISGKILEKFSLKQRCDSLQISYKIKLGKLQKASKHSSIHDKYNIKDWMELLGWYLSEGSIYVSKPRRYPGKVSWRGISHKVILNQKQEEHRKEIISLLERMNLKYCVEFNGISITNQILAEVLELESGIGSFVKHIPCWVFELDSCILQHLFKTMMMGDGDRKGDRYTTRSKQLAEDFLRLVHHLGFYGFIYQEQDKVREDIYRIQINKKRGIEPYISKYRNIKTMDYDGDVYCVEVSPNHTLLAGRNTKLNFCGQSFYGVLASQSCRFFSPVMANAITKTGHFIIKLTSEKIEGKGYKVIYNDTDSTFVVSKAKNLEEAEKIGFELQNYINNFYEEYIKKEFGCKSYLEMEYEKCFVKCIMPRVRGGASGAKKRYAGLMIENGKEKIDVTGMEAVRGDWTELAKKYQYEILNRIFHDKEIIQFTRKFVNDLRTGKFDELLVYRKSLRKGLEGYAVETPHKKAAKKIIERGGKIEGNLISYIMTTDGPEPIGYLRNKIDYEHYLEKQIKPIAESVLIFFGQSFKDVLMGSIQKGLGEF